MIRRELPVPLAEPKWLSSVGSNRWQAFSEFVVVFSIIRGSLTGRGNSLPPQDAAIGNPENPRRFRALPRWKRPWMGFSMDS